MPYQPILIAATRLVLARPPGLSNDLGHLVDLSLRTAEGAESLLRQLPRALVLGVAEQFDHAALVRGEAVPTTLVWHVPLRLSVLCICGSCVPRNLLHNLPNEVGPLAQMTFHARDSRLRLAGGDFLYSTSR